MTKMVWETSRRETLASHIIETGEITEMPVPNNPNERGKLGSPGGRRQQSRTTPAYEENGTEGG
jgi:hypothetical protein